MKVLIVGSGGREHAIAWKLMQSRSVTRLLCAPGNAGIASVAECVPIAADDIASLLAFAQREAIDLTVVGPEAPLTLGIADLFRSHGLKIFAPTKEAAQLESSKAFAKEFCLRHRIPTAHAHTFDHVDAALEHVRELALPLVVKADGLAAGKGVIICHSRSEAEEAVRGMMMERRFGGAGSRVVIEEFLEGEEASFIALCDGQHVLPLASSQDHKAAFDGDTGPNTGGMGAISPAAVLTPELVDRVMEDVMIPTVKGMAAEGRPFTGVLYAGLMIRDHRAKVLEFNTRFGDPETQPLMMRLQSDLLELFLAAVEGRLDQQTLVWDSRPAACVVMAAGGYPGTYRKGDVISGLQRAGMLPDTTVFHAGTQRSGDAIATSGGRVLGVTALGATMRAALNRAYEAVSLISWEGVQYRKDIGHRALK